MAGHGCREIRNPSGVRFSRRISFLFFLIIWRLVSVSTEQEPADPVRCLPHLAADGIQGHVHVAFNDQFVMDMPHDGAVAERLDGMHEDVAAYGLDDVLHELGAV